MNSPEIKKFIREHSALFWYIKKDEKENISPILLVETILNYGELNDIEEMIGIMGLENVADIFFKSISNGKRSNYFKPVQNYFTLYFQRHAPGNPVTKTA